jgi:hypothetical protein
MLSRQCQLLTNLIHERLISFFRSQSQERLEMLLSKEPEIHVGNPISGANQSFDRPTRRARQSQRAHIMPNVYG